MSGEALAREMQGELRRVGCDPGSVDGKWSGKARSALADFARRTSISISVEEPSLAALNAVRAQRGRICPLACDDDEEEQDGQCVTKRKSSSASRKPECDDDEVLKNGKCVAAPKKSKSASKSQSRSASQETTRRPVRILSGSSDAKCWDAYGKYVSCVHAGGTTMNGSR